MNWRPYQAGALKSRSRHDLTDDASVCYFILSDACFHRDEYAAALEYLDEALALPRKLGNRPNEWAVLAERTYPLMMLGRLDEALAVSEGFTQEQVDSGGILLSLLQTAVDYPYSAG